MLNSLEVVGHREDAGSGETKDEVGDVFAAELKFCQVDFGAVLHQAVVEGI